jgi:LCP family protein required for cell wall assembly
VVSPPAGGDRPDYKVYKAGRGRSGGGAGLDALRRRARGNGGGGGRDPKPPRERRSISPGRILRFVVLGVLVWVLLSLVLFMVSAQIQEGVSDEAEAALAGGSFFTGSTVLVLGSDERGGDSIDDSQTGPGRADTIMLVRARFGRVAKLSIPRDSSAEIPGHGIGKINAAFALGGSRLMIDTVEGFLGNGLEIDHLILVDFEDFPGFIDALGGVTVNNPTRICAPEFDNFFRGFNLRKGERELDGRRALGFARVRNNPCAPNETDLDRARRQQEVLSGIRGQMVSPSTFLRLPLISWRAPQTITSDLKGPGLLALATDLATGGTGETRVLQPAVLGPGDLQYTDTEKADAVDQLLGR